MKKLNKKQLKLLRNTYDGYNEIIALLDILTKNPNSIDAVYNDVYRNSHIDNLRNLYEILRKEDE